MDFPTAISSFFNNYANFNGRARRSEVWWMVLFNFLFGTLTGIIAAVIGDVAGLLNVVFLLATFIPWLSLWSRRLHDIGRSGVYQLAFLLPIVGIVLYFIWGLQDSEGSNQWGAPANGRY